MYKKDSDSWLKHWDFIVLDALCLQVAFILAYALSGNGINPYETMLYRDVAVFIEMANIAIMFLFGTFKNVLKRGYYVEFLKTVSHCFGVGVSVLLYLFLLQQGQMYSRSALIFLVPLYILVSYISRAFWKKFLRKRTTYRENRSLLIVTTSDIAVKTVKNITDNNYAGYTIVGLVFTDRDAVGETVSNIEIVANEKNTADYICKNWVDEVLIVTSEIVSYPKELIAQLAETGVIIHMNLAKVASMPDKKQFVEKIGNYTVLTTSINYASSRQLLLKRLMDIAGGLVGCIFTGILFLFVAPAIYIASPGPIFFSQERVGKNGKLFKMYKFRSMYMDAEERKAELMKDNKLGDGKMFKLDFDPRVIGNKILPDGTKKTGIGDFIRKSSIDEFPQFWNVLKGDMSIVGTRPPLISETNLYEPHHRVRLAIKPGITGMWQVSGRSDITDFEEVVRLDKEYIANWNIGLDIKILIKTIIGVLKRDGSM